MGHGHSGAAGLTPIDDAGACSWESGTGSSARPRVPRAGAVLGARRRFWIGPKKIAGFNLGNVTATLLAAVAIGQLGIAIPGPISRPSFSSFSSRWVRRRPAVLPRVGQGRPEADPVLGDRAGPVPDRAHRLRKAGRARPRFCRRSVRRIASDLRVDRCRDGPDQPARDSRRTIQGLPGRDSDRICRHLPVRHDRVRDRPGAAGSEVDPCRPAGSLRRI